ncbi:MAG: ABC transporter permease, partial [Verrucomicrobiota bacterium]
MFFSPFLATRYLRPKRSFVSIITIISILGVSLGVWALVVVVAVFTGYGEKIKSSILGFEPHIVITAGGVIREVGEVYEELLEVEEFESVTPFVQGRVIMDFDGLRNAPTIRGILPPTGAEFERLDGMIAEEVNPAFPDDPDQLIKKGTFDVSDPYSCVVGDSLAKGMGIEVGSRLLLYSPGDMQKILDAVCCATASRAVPRSASISSSCSGCCTSRHAIP